MYFEVEYGRSDTTWALTDERYGLWRESLVAEFDAKSKIVLEPILCSQRRQGRSRRAALWMDDNVPSLERSRQ